MARIAIEVLPSFKAKVEALNKRLARKGLGGVLYTVNVDGPFADVEVVKGAGRFGGWEVVGAIKAAAGVALLHGEVPEEWRAHPDRCEHCGITRRRGTTLAIQSEEGELKQVGKTCLKDFVGNYTAENMLAFWDIQNEVQRELLAAAAGEGEYGHATAWYLPAFLATCDFVMEREGGFKPVSAGSNATALKAAEILENKGLVYDAARLARVQLAIDWAKNLTGVDGFLANIREIALANVAPKRSPALAAAILPAYSRSRVNVTAAVAATTTKKHLGTVGQKIEVEATYKRSMGYDNAWGGGVVVVFECEGSDLVWITANSGIHTAADGSYDPLPEGSKVLLRATVKSHDTYRGEPQTKITRAKIVRRL